MSRKTFNINNETYSGKPINYPLVIDKKYKGSLVIDQTAPLLFGNLTISYNYLQKAPTKLLLKLFSDNLKEKDQFIIRLHSDKVDSFTIKDLFFDSVLIDDNFISENVSIYFDGYQLIKPFGYGKKLSLLPVENNSVYVPPVGGGGSSDCMDEDLCQKVKDFFHANATLSLNTNVSYSEKGLVTNITFSHAIDSKDDTLSTALFDNVDIMSNLNNDVVFNKVVDTITKTLAATVESGNNPSNVSKTVVFYIPQFTGQVDSEVANVPMTYHLLNSGNKHVQSSDTITRTFDLNDERAYFVSRNANANFVDPTNGFPYSVGDWNDTEAFIIKKTVTMYLHNGDTEEMTLYLMRLPETNTFNIRIQ